MFLCTTKFRGYKNFGGTAPECPPWLQTRA